MKKGHREDTVGPWAEEKLSALEEYLRFYCTALSKKQFKLVYIDGFAGAPVTSVRQPASGPPAIALWDQEDAIDQTQFVLGSPLRALSIEPGFSRHYFFDLDERRASKLSELKGEYPGKWIHVAALLQVLLSNSAGSAVTPQQPR